MATTPRPGPHSRGRDWQRGKDDRGVLDHRDTGVVFNEYWSSPAGFRHQHRARSLRAVLVSVDQEPQQKGRSGTRQVVAFREAARQSWVSRRPAGWPRARLALDLSFRTTRKQPPRIERLAKHYLDLLEGNPDDASPIALYPNDSKVKLLFVHRRHGWRPERSTVDPRIHLMCRTRADAVADLAAAHELAIRFPELDDWDDDERHGDWADWEAEDWTSVMGNRDQPDPDPQLTARLRLLSLGCRQERFLRDNDRYLTFLFRQGARVLLAGQAPPSSSGLQSSDAYRALQADLAAKCDELMRQLDHMHVRLPPLPTTVGTSAAFRTNLREACEVFLGRFPLLRPLVVPLRVTMLVVPGLESNTEKDLDNIALDVLPAIQEVFKPPLDRISDPEPPLLWEPEKGDQELASGVTRTVPERVGVTSFQVIELRRRRHHPREGSLRVVFGDGQNVHSLWTAAAKDVGRFLDRLE